MSTPKFGLRDVVKRKGNQEARTVEVISVNAEGENIYLIQLGRDAVNRVWAKESELELIQRAPQQDGEPGFVPGRSITDVGY